MDFNQNEQDQHYQQYEPDRISQPVPPVKSANSLASASMILGILSIPALCLVYPGLIFASCAIIMALLSKGYEPSMHGYAKTGIATALVSFSLLIVMFTAIFGLLFSNPAYRQEFTDEYNTMYEQIYGTESEYNPFDF